MSVRIVKITGEDLDVSNVAVPLNLEWLKEQIGSEDIKSRTYSALNQETGISERRQFFTKCLADKDEAMNQKIWEEFKIIMFGNVAVVAGEHICDFQVG